MDFANITTKLILSIFLFFYTLNLFGQVTSSVPTFNIIPSSPEGAALKKYGEIPVSLNTGIPNISIPLYNIKIKGIEVPVTLTYHAAGIKVDELASNVGLGWTLNIGGSQTSNVNGIPDLEERGWANVPLNRQLPQSGNLRTLFVDPSFSWESDPDYQRMFDLAYGLFDTQPDVFYLNLNGRTLNYFYDQSHQIYLAPFSRVKFNHDHEVVDENDNIFTFNEVESSSTHYSYVNFDSATAPQVPSFYFNETTYLSRIKSAYGDSIIYHYEPYYYHFANRPSRTRYSLIDDQLSTQVCVRPKDTYTSSYTDVSGKRIKEIIASNQLKIEFIYAQNRTDLPGAAALTGIIVKNIISGEVLFRYTLTYGYYYSGVVNNANSYRLKLLSVQQDGEKPYSFEYNLSALPNRIIQGEDHWGYNNGTMGGDNLLPIDSDRGFYTGANRAPNANTVQNGILEKINFPTGGSTSFEYEPNIATVVTGGPGPTNVPKAAYGYGVSDTTVSVPFVVNSGSTFRYSYHSSSGDVFDPETGELIYAYIKVLNSSGNVVASFIGDSPTQGSSSPYLPTGSYTIVIESSAKFSNAFLTISWTEVANIPVQAIDVIKAGVRIKKITSNFIIGEPLVKTFEYTKPTDKSVSSAVVQADPVYSYTYRYATRPPASRDIVECFFNAQSSSSLSPSLPVIYSNVNVYTSGSQNGYTANRFTAFNNVAATVRYPFVPFYVVDWTNGLPIETINYSWDVSHSVYKPVNKVVNEYKLAYGSTVLNQPHEKVMVGYKVSILIPEKLDIPSSPAEFEYDSYNNYASWMYQTGQTKTVYDPVDTSKQIITKEKYYYDNPNHIERTRIEVSKSTGESYKVSMRYPKDIDANYSYNSSPVVEKRVMINNSGSDRLVTSEIITYNNQPGAFPLAYYNLKNNAPLAPSSLPLFSGLTAPSNYEKRLDYAYDSNHNIIQTVKEGLANTTYLWGYKKQYPIAEIKNATYQQVIDLLGQTQIDQLNDVIYTDAQIRNILAVLRNINNAMVTIYTYKPLVGMTSSTDAKGQTTYYEYDELQRLKSVKDQNGKIIRQTDYHYQNR